MKIQNKGTPNDVFGALLFFLWLYFNIFQYFLYCLVCRVCWDKKPMSSYVFKRTSKGEVDVQGSITNI